ncbi:MAG: M23 family metallopeptidase [Tepidamorphaceae bacterium]
MEAVELTLANLSDIGRIVTRLPIRKPVGDGASISSGFGPRTDPFLGKPAMHQGLDFRASKGEEVMAAGAGTVLSAGRHGGYGNMVEIDHGQGLTSRYAHLSRIMVKAGDIVTPGQLIGKVGSTGRSTGPHLHFEVRRNGAARNPITYIRAGRKL